MFKKVVSMSLAVVAISLCATGEVIPQNLGSIKVTTPMYTADQVDEIVSEAGDFTTNNTELVRSIKEVAQEKLSNAQISAIDSVVDERKTVVTYTDGTTASFDVEGELTYSIFPDKQIVESVKIGTAVTSIGYQAFEQCENLRGVMLPNSITTIGEYAFNGCYTLQSITIPNSVTNIGYVAFGSCFAIQNITIPKSVTYIGSRAFENTEELTSCIFEGKSIQEVQAMANYPWSTFTSVITTWNDASSEEVQEKFSSISSEVSNKVSKTGDEQISGSKTFLNDVTVRSASNPPFTISTRDSDKDFYNISWGIYDDFWGFRFGMIGIDDPTINTIKFPFKSGTLAIDGDVVHKSGNESISGVKTFTQNVVINASLRNGNGVTANGNRSHAQGISSTATGNYSHAEGDDTKAIGDHSHAEGYLSEAKGIDSHAEGHSTIASGKRAHAEGFQTSATNNQSHAEGRITVAGGYHSHAEGRGSIALGDQSHAEGAQTIAAGHQSHTDGFRAMSAEQGESVNDIVNPHSGAYVWQGMPDTVSLVTDIAAEDALTPGQRLTPEELTNTYYHSHGVGTFNIKPVGGLDGFWIGDTNFTDHVATLTALKRDYDDVSVNTNVWFISKDDGSSGVLTYKGTRRWGNQQYELSGGIRLDEGFWWTLKTNNIPFVSISGNLKDNNLYFSDNTNSFTLVRGSRFALDTETKGYLPLTGGTLIGDLVATSTGSDTAIIAQDSTDDVGVAMGFGYSGLWPMNKEIDGWELLGDYGFLFDRNNERWTLSGFAIEKKTLSEETSTLSFEMDVDNHWQLNINNPSETTPGDTEVYTLTLPLTNGTIATTYDITASIAASSKNSIQKAQDWFWGDVSEGSRIYLGNFNNDDSYSKEFLFEDAKNPQVWVFPTGQQTNTIAYKSDITASIAASSTAVFSSPQQQLDGWTLPEYISALSKYKWDTQSRTCYREFVENDMLILRAVTNIDLTAVGNIDALKAMEDSIEIRKPPVAQTCYSVGYASLTNVLVATNANFKIDGNYLAGADITISYDVSGTTTTAIISPSSITAAPGSITIAESALATARSEIGRTITFTIQTAYGHTSITAVVAEPPTP